ncbi:MAG: alpha-ketoglutarate-dependent dioxygenase AlkB [Bacteroidetes bacterium]|nr:alpha-ketoglutarate-dependent dioxygenase AlkB [Bacteroidota bacterium]MDA0903290.1 alpha-ketoglutarate-dependent dioxygenase AlkB [Bacteroidota bacterium]MDA1242151.1 alpha-ketoglutarate-dependent dioxygenase AlkB [Bacteroidota bacterium]
MDKGSMGQKVVWIEELDAAGKNRSCWVEQGAFAHLDVNQWWNDIAHSTQGWRHNDIRVFGAWHKEPRWTAWWGPPYRYANVQWPAQPLDGEIRELCDLVSRRAGSSFNAVLINGYRDGQDSMGWHRDNEREMDTACIASLSLGATRTFKVRDRRNQRVIDIPLSHGDLLVMEHLQDDHEHSLPKRLGVKDRRLNFTFRRLV